VIGLLISAIFIALIITAYMVIFTKSIAQSIMLFMGFGLGATVLYFLFSAPDVALTEAVIGAGLTSVIFLVTLLQTTQKGHHES
jgi:uncharacterized MnhB-related membrane protein